MYCEPACLTLAGSGLWQVVVAFRGRRWLVTKQSPPWDPVRPDSVGVSDGLGRRSSGRAGGAARQAYERVVKRQPPRAMASIHRYSRRKR